MRISTKGRYALKIMIDLALNNNGDYIPLKDIAIRQEVSIKYLEQIISKLNKAGYLQSTRGNTGGYKLARKPEEYKIGDILRLAEGDLAPIMCLASKDNKCEKQDQCITLSFWKGLDEAIENYVDSKTLANIVNG
ncbi:HTH-type transcriptional regulator CymR [compost metagenome]